MSDDGYNAYVWYNTITDVCWILSCFILAIIILKFTSNHVCWSVGLMLIPMFMFGIKTKNQWG